MVIQTFWPGADAKQVQEQVTDRIARKLQETPAIDFLRSYSRPGESLIFFTIKDSAPAEDGAGDLVSGAQESRRHRLPRCRRACRDRTSTTNSATSTPTSTRWKATASRRRNCTTTPISCAPSLLRVPGVAKVDYFGDQDQRIYVEIVERAS